jgi:hypothetical protein
MGTAKRFTSSSVVALVVLLFGQGMVLAQLDKGGQKCVNAMAKDGAKVAATKGKDIGGCLKSGGSANCIKTDSAKVGGAASKTGADYTKNCAADPPAFGLPGVAAGTAAAISASASDEEEQLAFSIFGPAAATSGDKAGAKCQTTVNKTYEKAVATFNKGFGGCVKNALKAGGTEAALQACVLNDPGGKGAAALGKVGAGIDKACAGQDLDSLFPGTCVGENLANCVSNRVRCYSCRMQNAMHGLHANCDALDDGSVNGSCAAGRPITCELDSSSNFAVEVALATIPVPARGSMDIATGGSNGVRSASCNIRDVDPFNLPGVGFVCLAGATGCPAGRVDCDGGSTGGIAVAGNSNVGSCTGNSDCESQCEANCGGPGTTLSSGFGCEGFCSGDGSACVDDAECGARGAGACYGQDGVPFGNVCECICVNTEIGATMRSGDIICQLGVTITVETAAPCDGNDVLIDFGSVCTPLTTGPSVVALTNFNKQDGALRSFSGMGTRGTCFDYDANDSSSLLFQGGVTFFGSTLGDLLTGVTLGCQ